MWQYSGTCITINPLQSSLGAYFLSMFNRQGGLFDRGLLNLVKCITKSKEEGEEEADLSNGSLLPVLKLEQTNIKQTAANRSYEFCIKRVECKLETLKHMI